jgi:hypothetical protein
MNEEQSQLSRAIFGNPPASPEPSASQLRLTKVRELWQKSKESQLEIGRLLYEERAERFSVGGRGMFDGFHQWLREADIPKTSAYRRIAEYEISIGERAEDDAFDKKPVPDGTSLPSNWIPVHKAAQGATPPASPKKQVHSEGIASGGWWEKLYYQLNRLVPTISDGQEHALVVMLRQAATQSASSPTEKQYREYVVTLLRQAAKEFTEYADKLDGGPAQPEEATRQANTTKYKLPYTVARLNLVPPKTFIAQKRKENRQCE